MTTTVTTKTVKVTVTMTENRKFLCDHHANEVTEVASEPPPAPQMPVYTTVVEKHTLYAFDTSDEVQYLLDTVFAPPPP
jgi:hypothetical protein